MEAGTRLLPPSPPPKPPRTHLKNSSFSSVAMLDDQSIWTVSSVPAASIVQSFPASTLSKEQQDDYRTICFNKEGKRTQATPNTQQADVGSSHNEQKAKYDFDEYWIKCENQLLYHPGLAYPFPPLYCEGNPLLAMSIEQVENASSISQDKRMRSANCPKFVTPVDVVTLATRALMASRYATSLSEKSNLLAAELDESHIPGSAYDGSTKEIIIEEKVIIRSTRSLERHSKKLKVPKNLKSFVYGGTKSADEIIKKIDKSLYSNDPLRLFLWGPETKQLLTVKEEKELFVQIQDLMRLEEVQRRLWIQFNREPTLVEWANSIRMSCQVLRSCLSSGRCSREKMIFANFRLVVHLARQYEGKGLDFQDLLQEGSRGLMKSLDKFRPKAGCKFSTYAYWWIRQSIRKAIFQNSRIIRLPDNIFAFLKDLKEARKLCIQEGHLPTNEELAKRVGITVKKLEKLLRTSREPVSIQNRARPDHDVTFQEITADPGVENPELIIAKQLMRQHVHYLLKTLKPRERQILQYRFGMHNNKQKTLTEIGDIYGLSKERVRQLESRALDKLKECLPSQGLEAYLDLLS